MDLLFLIPIALVVIVFLYVILGSFFTVRTAEVAVITRFGKFLRVAVKAGVNVWSAALSQAKNDGDVLVCANVYGLCWRVSPGHDGMRCALVLLK
jgi:hypothetical protein